MNPDSHCNMSEKPPKKRKNVLNESLPSDPDSDPDSDEEKKFVKKLTKAHVPDILKGLDCTICGTSHKSYSALLKHSKVIYLKVSIFSHE